MISASASRAALVAVALALLAGCAAPKGLYGWGNYEQVLYVAAVRPGTLSVEAQIQELEKDRSTIQGAGQRLPPGWHAHLGSLYYQVGRADLAREELLAEKSAFPESAILCDTLLKNLSRSAEARP